MESPLQTANDRTEKKVKSKKLTDTEHLLRSLKDKDKAVRDAAAWSLGDIRDASAVQPLIQTLKDEDEFVRSTAASHLGKIGDTRALEPLREALNDADTDVRESAERAFNIIAERSN